MDVSIAGIACQLVKAKCSEYYETAKTKAEAFCRDVGNCHVYQSLMGKMKGFGEEARALWVCIFSRKTTESEATSNIRAKYDLQSHGSVESRAGYASQVRAEGEQRRAEKEALLDDLEPIIVHESMADLNESIEDLQGKLVTELLTAEGQKKTLTQKKMTLIADIAQFKRLREKSMSMDSKGLANDLYLCRSHKALVQRLEKTDVPVVVRNELKAKLNRVK